MIMTPLIPLFLTSVLALVQCAATVPIGNVKALDVPTYQLLAKYNEIKRSQPWLSLLPANNVYGDTMPQQQEIGFDYRGLRGKRVSRLAQVNLNKNLRDYYELDKQ